VRPTAANVTTSSQLLPHTGSVQRTIADDRVFSTGVGTDPVTCSTAPPHAGQSVQIPYAPAARGTSTATIVIPVSLPAASRGPQARLHERGEHDHERPHAASAR
jgi:hypothetical protein